MNRVLGSIALVVALAAAPAMAESGAKTSSADQSFAKDAARGGMTEVQLGKLAQERASNSEVRSFGQRLVTDHSKANDDLKKVASNKGLDLPEQISSDQKQHYDKLAKLQGPAFDEAFIDHMVNDHKKDIAEFEKEANSGKDPDIKQFATSTLPTLQEHLRIAEELNTKSDKAAKKPDRRAETAHSAKKRHKA